MTQHDITITRLIVILAGLLVVIAEVCLLLHALVVQVPPAIAIVRGLLLVAGMLVIVLALRVRK